MGITVGKIIYPSIALLIVFLLASTLIMPYFSSQWRYAEATCWIPEAVGSSANCTYDSAGNTTVIAAATHRLCAGVDAGSQGGKWCQAIVTEGGYRTTNQGLTLLVLVLAFVGFALTFLKASGRI